VQGKHKNIRPKKLTNIKPAILIYYKEKNSYKNSCCRGQLKSQSIGCGKRMHATLSFSLSKQYSTNAATKRWTNRWK
jgi:hypothetical protein